MVVDITLRGVPLDEELIYFVRRHGTAIERSGACRVAIGRTNHGVTVDVQVDGASALDRAHVREEDPDAFLAVRNAFCILAHALRPDLGEAAE